MEAGYCWQPLYNALEDSGHDIRLTHPIEVKVIAKARVKTDKIDSETLNLPPQDRPPPRVLRLAKGHKGTQGPGQ